MKRRAIRPTAIADSMSAKIKLSFAISESLLVSLAFTCLFGGRDVKGIFTLLSYGPEEEL